MNEEKMKELGSRWLDSLDQEEQMLMKAIDAYFASRRPSPGKDPLREGLVEEPKTTDEIMDDLEPMISVRKRLVAGYMVIHGYGMKAFADGTLKWDIWRYVDETCLE